MFKGPYTARFRRHLYSTVDSHSWSGPCYSLNDSICPRWPENKVNAGVSFFKRAAAGQCQCNHAITAPGGGAAIALRGAGHPSYHLTVLVVSSRESLEQGEFLET